MYRGNITSQIEFLKAHQKKMQVQMMLDTAFFGNVPKLEASFFLRKKLCISR